MKQNEEREDLGALEIKWTPTKSDINWCNRLIDMLKDGGVWATSVGLIYSVDKESKNLKLTAGDKSHQMHKRNIRALKEIGYHVTD